MDLHHVDDESTLQSEINFRVDRASTHLAEASVTTDLARKRFLISIAQATLQSASALHVGPASFH